MSGKHEGDQPKLEPFRPPAHKKSTGDSDGSGGKHSAGEKKK
jgi:hypothetical protein